MSRRVALLLTCLALVLAAPVFAQVPGLYVPLQPCRLFDSRIQAPPGSALPAGSKLVNGVTYYFDARGACNILEDATSVSFAATVVDAEGHGWMWVWESSLPTPSAGTYHFGVETETLSVTPRLSYPAGEDPHDFAVRLAYARAHLIFDAVGYTVPLP